MFTRLEQEWPAILRWMIEGAVEWNTNGLEVPEVIKAASAEYLNVKDTLAKILSEPMEFTPENKLTSATLNINEFLRRSFLRFEI